MPEIKVDAIQIVERLADECTVLETALALRTATEALRRLAAIKAAHLRYVTTDVGTIVYPSIHGHVLHRLLFGVLDDHKPTET